jgi:hypothetical protein
VASLAPLLTPFPTFLQFRNMLLLQELQPSNAWPSSSSLTAFYSAPPIGGGQQRGGPAPAPTPAPYPVNNTGSGSGYKGKKRKTTGGGAAAPFPSLQNPWTGAIHMHPMAGPCPACLSIRRSVTLPRLVSSALAPVRQHVPRHRATWRSLVLHHLRRTPTPTTRPTTLHQDPPRTPPLSPATSTP